MGGHPQSIYGPLDRRMM